MKIPLSTEVAKYMEEKFGWPQTFCLYYGDKFYNHYSAQGWKLSNGVSMKDWKAAVNSQWKTPKYKEDIEMLEKCKSAIKSKGLSSDIIESVRYMCERIKEGNITNEAKLGWYDWMKGKIKIQFSERTLERIKAEAGNSIERGKVLCVDELIRNGSLQNLLKQAV